MSKNQINDLTEKMLLELLEYSDVKSLLGSSLVCKKLNEMIGQNQIIMKKTKLQHKINDQIHKDSAQTIVKDPSNMKKIDELIKCQRREKKLMRQFEASGRRLRLCGGGEGSLSGASGLSSLAVKNQLEHLNSMREALYAQDGWSCQNVNQDTNWDVPGSPEPAPRGNEDPAAATQWKSHTINNGTELWEANLRNGGEPAPEPVQKTSWNHTPTTNIGGTWGEDDDGGENAGVWIGNQGQQASEWNQGSGSNTASGAIWLSTTDVGGANANISKKDKEWAAGGQESVSNWCDPRDAMRMMDTRKQMQGNIRGVTGRLNGSTDMWQLGGMGAGHVQVPGMNKIVRPGTAAVNNPQWPGSQVGGPKDIDMNKTCWGDASSLAVRRPMGLDDGTSLWGSQGGRNQGIGSNWNKVQDQRNNFGRNSIGGQPPSAHHLRNLVQQIQKAVQDGYLNRQILNQPLAPQTFQLLNSLLNTIQQLQYTQQSIQRNGDVNSIQLQMTIQKQKQQISQLQSQIAQQQSLYIKSQGHESGEDMSLCVRGNHDPFVSYENNFAGLGLKQEQTTHPTNITSQQSLLNQWKLPLDNKAGDPVNFSRAPGTTAKQSLPPMTPTAISSIGIHAGTWSSDPNDSGWLNSIIESNNKDWPASNQSPAFTDLVETSKTNSWSNSTSDLWANSTSNAVNGTWFSTWLLLKNLTAQIDESTLRTLCVQHGNLQHFQLYLNHGLALCKYNTREEASKAQLALNNCVLSNTTICAESPSDTDVSNILKHLGVPSGSQGGDSGNGNGASSNSKWGSSDRPTTNSAINW